MEKIVLASASPRRKELLMQIGLEFCVIPAKGEELITSDDPETVVRSLSHQKALEIVINHSFATPVTILGADTVVAYNGHILGKPVDEADAYRMLQLLQGKTHTVFTGITFLDSTDKSASIFCCKTDVTVFPMSDTEIYDYISSQEPMDKAGAYGIQGLFAAFIEKIDGDYNNVVGLPVSMVYQHLKSIQSNY